MLLKIEVFPAGEPLRSRSNSSNSNSNNTSTTLDAQQQLPIESSQPPLYVCLGTSGSKPASKLEDNDDDDHVDDADAGRLLTIGRSKVAATATATAVAEKNDNNKPMVLIPATDKSVSREHCLLRLVASKTAIMDKNKLFQYHPRPMPSRNEQEEEACLENEQCHNLCVVVESMGKLGTYLVVEPQTLDSKQDDTPSKKAAKNSDKSEDDETDEEDDAMGSALLTSQQQQTQQSKSQQASGVVVLLPALSDATKQIIGSPQKVAGTTLVPIENSLVLQALSCNNNGRVILQCGKMGSTIVISRVAVHFVQAGITGSSSKKGSTSSSIANAAPWYKRLYVIGATEGETVTWNNNKTNNDNNNNNIVTPTTLVLTAAYNATPKQLAAWSRGIPLVTPDFMQALLQRTSSSPTTQDTMPKFQDYMPKADGNAFWNKTANPNLWSGTIFLSTLDASASTSSSKKTSSSSSSSSSSSNSDATEMLVASAGTSTVVRLYEMSTDQLQDLARRLETDATYAQSCFGLQPAASSSSSSGGGRSGLRRTKSSTAAGKNNNKSDSVVAVAAAKLLQDYNIPLYSTRALAKLLTEQQPLTTPEGRILGGSNNNNNNASAVAAVTEKTTLPHLEVENSATRKVQGGGKDKDVEMQENDSASVAVQETPPIDSSASSSKRRRQGEDEQQESSNINNNNNSASQPEEESASLLLEQCSKKQRHLSPVEEEPATSAASKNDKEALRTLEQQPQGGNGGDKNEKMASSSSRLEKEKDKRNAASSSSQEINQDKHDESNDKNKKEKSKSKSSKEHNKNNHDQQHQGKRCSLAASTTKQGWLVAAPSKTSKRQAYLRSRTEITEQFGYEDLGPVAETEVVKGLLRRTNTTTTTTTTGQQQQRGLGTSSSTAAAGPDFKRFWKNEIAGRETNTTTSARPAAGRHGRRRHRPRFVLVMANKNKGDSIMQVEFHEERQALEEEQRKADQLFCDPGSSTAAAAPRRRRKA